MGGRLEEALQACRKAVRARPDHAEAHMLLAEAQRLLGDQARAEESTARALRLRPGWTAAQITLALADLYREFNRPEEAEARYRAALAAQPELDDARFNLAGILYGGGRRAEAIAELERLLERHPDAQDVRERLAQLLFEERSVARLEAVCREGIRRFPRAPAFPQKLGSALWFQQRHAEALDAYAAALERSTDEPSRQEAALSTANCLLVLGRHAEGWRVFQGRVTRAAVRRRFADVMDSPASLAGPRPPARIRIRTEQGVGDEIFFLRFAAALRARGDRLSVSGEPKLAALLSEIPALFEAEGAPADYTVCSGDLPLASGEDTAPPLPLPVDPARQARMGALLARFGPPPYVGVTWRGGLLPGEPPPAAGVTALQKKMPPAGLGGALARVDARVVILQRKPTAEDLQEFTRNLGRQALDLSAANDDLRDALALLSLLQDYVGVSNANFHLRAGIGELSARVLVSMPADWRWGLEGPRSPWFPRFKVYRRAFGDDWTGVFGVLAAEMAAEFGALQQS